MDVQCKQDGRLFPWDKFIKVAENYTKNEKTQLIHLKGSMDQEGGELGLFQILKHNKATLTYAMLVRYQFTNQKTKLPTQAMRDNEK